MPNRQDITKRKRSVFNEQKDSVEITEEQFEQDEMPGSSHSNLIVIDEDSEDDSESRIISKRTRRRIPTALIAKSEKQTTAPSTQSEEGEDELHNDESLMQDNNNGDNEKAIEEEIQEEANNNGNDNNQEAIEERNQEQESQLEESFQQENNDDDDVTNEYDGIQELESQNKVTVPQTRTGNEVEVENDSDERSEEEPVLIQRYRAKFPNEDYSYLAENYERPGTIRSRVGRIPWSGLEILAIEHGLRIYKDSLWASIKSRYPHILSRRTNVHIKDKARTELNRRKDANTWEDLGAFRYIEKP